MHLKYLEIQGFKSFPDKTRVTFEQGYTGIVGPNGSGKSNISDAIKWVLGEQSTKQLRGGKMEDVIFGGTQLRKPMGFAQVSLCLDNTDKRIADAGDEIVVTRRYYRSGDSEYLLGGATVRLRDVRETFMDTGLGRDGYSIIGQGRIAEIVGAKSNERREIFEEASGIAKYRFRKTEAERKLDAAEDNLSRLRDIIDVLQERLEPLRVQSEKAQKFLELSGEKKNLEITLYCDIIDRARENLRTQDDKIEIAKRDYELAQGQMADYDALVERLGDENRARNVEIERHNEGILATNERIAAVEQEAAVERNNIAHSEEQIAELLARAGSLTEGGSGIRGEIERKEAEIEAAKAELSGLEALIADAQRELNALIERGEISDRNRAETARRLTELQSEITDLRVAVVGAESTCASLAARSATLDEQLPQIRERLESAQAELAENEDYHGSILRDIQDCDNRIKGYTLKLDSRAGKLAQLAAELEKKTGEASELEHKISVLKDMDKSLDGYQFSVKRVVEASQNRRLRGIVGGVASLLSVQRGCELAIETALGAAAQNVVVEDERAAKDAIAFLKETKAGRATFLPLDTVKPSNFDGGAHLSDGGVVGLASSLVTYDKRYERVVSNLLGRIVVADDLNAASALAKKLNYRYRIVTMDGQVINAGGSYTGGFTSRQAGFFGRRAEIETLENRVKELRQSLVAVKQEHEKLLAEKSALEAEITAINSDLITHNEDRIRVEAQLERLRADRKTFGDAVAEIEAELARNRGTADEKQALIAESDARIETLGAEIARMQTGQEGEGADAFMQRRDELSNALSERRIARVEKQKDIEKLEYALGELQRQQSEAAGMSATIETSIAALREAIAGQQADIADKEQEAETLRALSAEHRATSDAAVAGRNEAERQITEARAGANELIKRREELSQEVARLEERKIALQNEFDTTGAKLWEEYELTRSEAGAFCVPFSSITELRSQVNSLRSKIRSLGNVNVGAIEEFKEVSEQHGFLTAQVEDVEKSKAELLKLIAGLEGEMRTIFTKSFNEINNHFRRVFVELFGGGSANLSLTDENDVLESGIEIDVQPPGKVIKNLSALSGGEQALVAIAIYFAILAVNPSPFCILDEIDSALDEANVNRFAGYIKRVTGKTQIITITHRRGTMEAADVLYGVTMQEEGVSKLLKLGIEEAQLVISK